MEILGLVLLVAIVAAVIAVLSGMMVTKLYRKVSQSQALVVSKTKTIDVTFTGALVVPVVHRAELMDIGVKVIEIEKSGNDGLICRDNIRADIRVSFYVRVNPTGEDVRKVAQLVGCANASNIDKLVELFSAKFAESLKTAGKRMDFVELYDKRDEFRSSVIGVIGEDLNGYVLDDVAIEYLEQTPMNQLDPTNVLDAEGIKKITDITTREQVLANEFSRDAQKRIKAKDVETQQAMYEMDRQEKAAEFRAQREMATTQAREESMTVQVQAEERLKAEQARLTTEEQVGIQNENTQREVEVAGKNRERVLAVETERIEKARRLEVVSREIETTTAQKDLEVEKAKIGELAKARIAVDKTVAEQEESILTLRAVEEANRQKEAAVIAAGAQAEATLITTIKEAEAGEKAAQHKSRERLTLAEAGKTAAELESIAKRSIADGVRAEAAAEGLAQVEVRRAEAQAIEQVGLAEVRVLEATAGATRITGEAEGAATEARLRGEAKGLAEKAESMRLLEGVGQEYDLAVKNIDAEKEVRLAGVGAQVETAKAMGEALAAANIDIVGGSDVFVDRIMGAISAGKAVGGFAGASEATEAIAAPYLNGEKDLVASLTGALGGLGASGVADLTLARFLTLLSDRVGGAEGDLLREVVGTLGDKGIDGLTLRSLSTGS
ncbi:MAG TPA: hypothetical protein DEG43_15800 [Acidimicrobiaceae bacterium]|jgi:uncharacterized membrane protein YqiK|nr:hypothetical protein [Acidimicrobiaceae bacterium]